MQRMGFRSTWMASAHALAIVLAFSGCADEQGVHAVAAGVDRDAAFDAYLEEHVVLSADGESYLMEHDMRMPDLEAVRHYWELMHPSPHALSVLRLASGDDIWDRTERANINYCIRPADFGDEYDRLVEFMHRAASGWESAANVRFVHEPSLDTNACVRIPRIVTISIAAS